ncbi:MAG: crossover junction endodeoxyribonuclease RuvC [Candidatus Cloacimonetes bacterium 4572_65]|nr:MAG: crossover junction endodeoxyribonuclease RuvC [Candidatus Cloacimonetes bacterium 4572_65]
MVVIGIDPGTRFCGYGIIQSDNKKILAAGCDCIKIDTKLLLSDRIGYLFNELVKIIKEYKPEIAVVESIFYGKNIQSAFKLGHARGAILLAFSLYKIPVFEYAPKEIKKAVTGNGNANKQQVRYMIQRLVGMKNMVDSEDASDALAVAFTHFNRMRFSKLDILDEGYAKKT